MLAGTILMDDLRKMFLTDSALASHQYRQIGRSHLHSDINGTVQLLRIAHNAKPQLYFLYLLAVHKPIQDIFKQAKLQHFS